MCRREGGGVGGGWQEIVFFPILDHSRLTEHNLTNRERQTDRQIDTERERQRQRHRETEIQRQREREKCK